MTRNTGFSLIEVLFAIFIAGMLAMTVGYSLIVSLRSEARSRALQEATLVADQLSLGHMLAIPADEVAANLPDDWQFVTDVETQGTGPTQSVWTVTHVSLPSAAFRARLAWRAHPEQIAPVTP